MTGQKVLIAAVIALIIVAAGIMLAFGPGATGPAPAESVPVKKVPTQDEMRALVAEIAGQIDGDAFAALRPGDENTTAYIAIHDRLNAFRSANPEISYIYTMRKVDDTVEYVVDADYGSEDGVAIGNGYALTDLDAGLLAGYEGPTAEIYSIIYAYAPIMNATGSSVGIVGVDMGFVHRP